MSIRTCPLCDQQIVVDPNEPDDFRAHLEMDQLLMADDGTAARGDREVAE